MGWKLTGGTSGIDAEVDAASKALRTTLYDSAGAVVSPATATGLTAGTARQQPFDTNFNQTAMISPLRQQVIGTVTRVYGDSFADGIGAGEEDAGAFPATATVTGSATGAAASGGLTMTTGATIPSTGILQSTNPLPYLTGSVSHHQGAFTFPSANLTGFRVVSRRNSVDTPIESSAFNVVPTPITNSGLSNAAAGALVDGLSHRLEIWFQGNGAFFGNDGVVVHRMAAQLASPRTNTLDLNTTYEWTNAAGPIATLRVGQYTATDGYFFECNYNVANVSSFARGLSANRIGPTPRVYKIAPAFDANRTRVVIKFEAVAPATADTLLSLVKQTGGVDAGGATSIGVTVNKVLRIHGVSFSLKANAAAAAFGTLTLRQNPAGATVIGSPSWGRFDVGNTEAVAGAARTYYADVEEHEFSGAATLGASLSAQAVTNVVSIALYGFEYPIGN